MLFKQSLIWTNVLESGSYPHFSSSQKGCGGGIRNLNRNCCKPVKVGCRQRFSSVAGAVCALSWCSPGPAEHHSQPCASQAAAGTPHSLVMEDSSSQEVLLYLKVSQWHKEWSLNPFPASGCLQALPRAAGKRRRGLHLVKLDFCRGTEHYRS